MVCAPRSKRYGSVQRVLPMTGGYAGPPCRTSSATSLCAPAVDALRATHERVDERVGDMTEHGTDRPIEQARRELVGQVELDLARIRPQRPEPPLAVEVAKRPILERDQDRGGWI